MKKNKLIAVILSVVFLVTSTVNYTFAATIVDKFSNPAIAIPGQPVKVSIQLGADDLTGKGPADAVLALDISRSMVNQFTGIACTPGINCKIDVAKRGFKQEIVDKTDFDYNHESLVTFYGDPTSTAYGRAGNPAFITQAPLTGGAAAQATLNSNIDRVNRAPLQPGGSGIELGGCTSIGGGLNQSLNELAANQRANVPGFVILATDGLQNFQPSIYQSGILAKALSMKIKVFVIGIDVPTTDVREFTFCRTNAGSGGSFIPSGNPADPTDPTEPTRLYNDQNACSAPNPVKPTDPTCTNGLLDGEDYLVDLAKKTGGNYYPAHTSGDFTNALQDILSNLTFPLQFTLQDVLNPNVFLPINNRNTDVKVYKDFIAGSVCTGSPLILGTDYTIRPPDSPPVVAANVGLGFKIDLGVVPKGDKRCIEITARVNPAFSQPEGPYDIDIPDPNNYLQPSVPGVPSVVLPPISIIDNKITIRRILQPWVKTTGGDVASQGDFTMTRDLVSNPNPAADRNGQYIVFSQGTNTLFSSAKSWLVGPLYLVDLGKFKTYNTIHKELKKKICGTIFSGSDKLPNAKGVFEYTPGHVTWDGTSPGDYYNIPCAISGNNAALAFINGDLEIEKDYQPGAKTTLIVKGNITIDSDVTKIDAMLIADGKILTGHNGGIDQQLTIKGSLIGNLGAVGTNTPLLQRSLGDNCAAPLKCNRKDASEIINFDPSFFYYLSDYAGVSTTTYREERP